MNANRRWFIRSLAGGAVVVLSGCSADDLLVTTPTEPPQESPGSVDGSSSGPSRGDGLTVGLTELPRGLDPLVVDHRPSQIVIRQLFEGLYEYRGGSTELEPRLADSTPEESDDARRWNVELNPDARFHDGSPVRAADIAYSFRTPLAESSAVGTFVEMIDRVDPIDDQTVEFHLEAPDSSFRHRLTHPIVPERTREADPSAFNRETTVGSGPFELSRWETDGLVQLHRSAEYWGDRSPDLEAIAFTSVRTPEERANGLREGTVDVVAVPDSTSWEAVERLDGHRIVTAPRFDYFYVAFNCREGPTADPRVREAVDSAFDMDEAVETNVGPTGARQYSPLPRPVAEAWGMPLARWETVPHGKDIDRASELFDAAGVPTDYPWRLLVPPDDTREGIATEIAAGLQETGFTDVTVLRQEWGAFYGNYITGNQADYNLYLLGWQHIPDPDAFTYYLFGRTPEVLGITNGTFYGDQSERGADAAARFLQARRTTERSARRRHYMEGITAVLEDRAHLPAYHTRHAFGISDAVEGLSVVSTEDRIEVFGHTAETRLMTETNTND